MLRAKNSKLIVASLFICVAMLFVSFQTAAQGWFQQHPSINPWVLWGVEVVDSTHMWTVGADGVILFSRSGGWETTTQSVALSGVLYDVDFVDTSFGWTVGLENTTPFRGKIYSTTNGGQTWTDQSFGQNWPRLQAVSFIDRQQGWACGFNGSVLHTTNGGLSWSLSSVGATVQLYDIQFLNRDVGWLGGFKLYKTTNGGNDWTVLSDTGANSILMLDSLRGWQAGLGVRRTTDGGLTWTMQYEPQFEILPWEIAFADSLNGWCALWDQRLDPPPLSHRISMVRTTDGGTTWFEQYTGMNPMLGVSFDAAGDGCAVGLEGIMYSSDRGINWIRRSNGIYTQLNAIDIVDSLDVWAVGNEQTLIHTTDGGLRWFSMMSPSLADLRCVSFVGRRNGWVAGNSTPIYFTTDGGASWQVSPTAGNPYLRGLSFVDTQQGWAVGDNILHTTDGGITWTMQDISDGLAVDFVDPLHGWVVSAGGRVHATTNGGVNWLLQASSTTNHLTSVDFVDILNGWAVGANGTIVKTTNGGGSWSSQNSLTVAWLSGVRFVDASSGWVVGDTGIVLVTTNGGDSWMRQNSGTTQNLFAVDFVGNRMGWTVGSGGLIFHTTDGGGIVAVDEERSLEPSSVHVFQNYPNPFNPETKIEFSLTSRQQVKLTVFDLLGREVATLVDDVRPRGQFVVSWNPPGVSSGVYYYRLEVGGITIATKKMVLLR